MIRVALIDADDAVRQTLAPRLSAPVTLVDDTVNCDAALIIDPVRASEAEHFLKAGKHVLAAADGFTGQRLQSALTVCGKCSLGLVNFDRYQPSRQLIHRQVSAGELGKPGLIRSYRFDVGSADTTDLPRPLLRDLDMVLWFTNDVPRFVYALEQRDENGRRTGLHVHLGFPSGAMALVEYVSLPEATTGYSSLSLIGSTGAAYIDGQDNMQLIFGGSAPVAIPAEEGVLALSTAVQWFFEAVAGGTRTLGEIGDWGQVLAVSLAVQESLAQHRVILEVCA